MLYKKNTDKVLDAELFKNPTSEYRGTPFWAWNCKINKDMLLRQIEYLKEMGFGGFHMHVRSGMGTEYLGKEFMSLIRACVDKAEQEQMLAYLYDEDRWPSGAAGGFVTKNPRYRQKFLVFTPQEFAEVVSKEEGIETGKPYLLSCYDIKLNTKGELKHYKKISPDTPAVGEKWYAYVSTPEISGWYNNQTYVDVLSKEAIDEFIKVTHEAFKRAVGDEFGSTIPSIFTDEPQFHRKETLDFATGKQEVRIPWTTDIPETYYKAYNIDILDIIPELIWDLSDGKISKARYYYHDHICERFVQAFVDNCGKWCEENGIMLTGHVMNEESLGSQTKAVGEAMRTYRGFQLPGIDILCNKYEFSTAKQAQSAARQFGREGVLSELYGVTDWDFDFRGHKTQGDWQAALGVTVRVPHLSWVSMEGTAKRDYPASINYQSPWYKEYSYVENHFARLNTILTRGTPVCDVAVIHPVESCWLHWGPKDSNGDILMEMEQKFTNIIEWLLFGLIDFDFISESLLPEQCGDIGTHLSVGKMKYKTVIVPDCETIRKSTLDILTAFKERGGRVVFMGECPKYVDAEPSDAAKDLYDKCERIPFTRTALQNLFKEQKFLTIKNANGTSTDNLIYNLRKDTDCYWLFIAHGKPNPRPYEYCPDTLAPQDIKIMLNGCYEPVLYDTISGDIRKVGYEIKDGVTIIPWTIYDHDSLLLKLVPSCDGVPELAPKESLHKVGIIDFKHKVKYSLSEPNVLLLDLAESCLDDGEFMPEEEILRIDKFYRKQLYPHANSCQPWAIEEKPIEHYVTLRFKIYSEITVEYPLIALEHAELCKIWLNGEEVREKPDGYYVDESIKKVALPPLKKGENILMVKVPFGERIRIENCYLLGDFRVLLEGCEKTIIAPSKTIGFSSVAIQGLPFYSGNIEYETEIETPSCTLDIQVSNYRGALVRVAIDGRDAGVIAYAPYTLRIPNVEAGKHVLKFTLFGNRFNTFGALHNVDQGDKWIGPNVWVREDDRWCYEYKIREMGILKSPVITIYQEEK